MIHVMQYLGERATFSMIARNDEMNKGRIFEIARAFLRNTKQKQIDICLGSSNCSFSFFTDRYYSSTSASVRRNNFRAHAEELFSSRKKIGNSTFFPAPSTSSFVTFAGSVRWDQLLWYRESNNWWPIYPSDWTIESDQWKDRWTTIGERERF